MLAARARARLPEVFSAGGWQRSQAPRAEVKVRDAKADPAEVLAADLEGRRRI